MNARDMQAAYEGGSDRRWSVIVDEEAFEKAILDEAEAIATEKINDPLYVHELLHSDAMAADAVIAIDPARSLVDLLAGVITERITLADAKKEIVQWIASSPDVMRQARGNIEGESFDSMDRDDQWAD